jgi:hypothetical protein
MDYWIIEKDHLGSWLQFGPEYHSVAAAESEIAHRRDEEPKHTFRIVRVKTTREILSI